MEIIQGKPLDKLPFQDDLIRVGDLIYFEGPLLTLFEDSKSDDLYLYDWADKDEEYNRWLIYRSDPELLSKFIQQIITYQELFNTAVKDGFYAVDINQKLEYSNIKIMEYRYLPIVYQPNAETYFDEADAPHFNRTKNFINKYIQKKAA